MQFAHTCQFFPPSPCTNFPKGEPILYDFTIPLLPYMKSIMYHRASSLLAGFSAP